VPAPPPPRRIDTGRLNASWGWLMRRTSIPFNEAVRLAALPFSADVPFIVTYPPGDEKAKKAAMEAIKELPHDLRPALPSQCEITYLEAPQRHADVLGCRYCTRRRSGAATCEGCGAPQ